MSTSPGPIHWTINKSGQRQKKNRDILTDLGHRHFLYLNVEVWALILLYIHTSIVNRGHGNAFGVMVQRTATPAQHSSGMSKIISPLAIAVWSRWFSGRPDD